MISERILKITTGILLFIMMFYIMNGLAKQLDPQKVIDQAKSPDYTTEYVNRLECEKFYYKQQANYYEKSYDDITRILER